MRVQHVLPDHERKVPHEVRGGASGEEAGLLTQQEVLEL